MTGLDVKKERIIEVAAIVTDLNFKELASYESVVKQDQKYIDAMDDWNKKTHGESGLTAKIPNGVAETVVETNLIELIAKNFPRGERAVLAGNSISQDRLFIDEYMPKLSQALHYRMLDVTAWKVLMVNKFKVEFKKKNQHRAIDDIRESIEELKHYLQYVKF